MRWKLSWAEELGVCSSGVLSGSTFGSICSGRRHRGKGLESEQWNSSPALRSHRPGENSRMAMRRVRGEHTPTPRALPHPADQSPISPPQLRLEDSGPPQGSSSLGTSGAARVWRGPGEGAPQPQIPK